MPNEKIEVDLDAYCARIGYGGPRTPTVETLRALHTLHPAAIVLGSTHETEKIVR